MQKCPVVRHWRLIPPAKYAAYLWCMYVTGTGADLTKHCQAALIGTKSRKFSKGFPLYADKPPIVLDEVKTPFAFYICGSHDHNWRTNLHIAFRSKPGNTLEVRTPREHWIIDNAERIEISESMIDPSDPNSANPEFRTCRVWQFAHYIKRCLDEKKSGGLLPDFLF